MKDDKVFAVGLVRKRIAFRLFRCLLCVALCSSMLPTFAMQSYADEPEAPVANSDTSVSYSQADGYEAYQGWQDSPWDEASDPWYGSSGGTTRKGYPAWSLADPLSIGVTGYTDSSGMVTGDSVVVVTDTGKTDTSGAGSFADPLYYKNVILPSYDVTQGTIQFTFNYVGAGGVNLAYTLDPNTPSGIIIATSDNPDDWNSSGDPMNWVASDSVVWEATTSNTVVHNTSDNWWKNIVCSVDTDNLEANQTYYLAIKNGTAGQWGRVYADIVFEFSTDMNRQAVWDGNVATAGYGREQGNGGTKLGVMSPDPSDVTLDLNNISSCWNNAVSTPMDYDDNGDIVFKVHADGSGSNWQTISSWTNNSEIKVYDVDPVGQDGYNVEGIEPVATIAKGTVACSLANPDRDWPSIDGVNIALSDLESGKGYWLVFTGSFLPGNATSPLRKPIVFGFKTAPATSWDVSAAGDNSVRAKVTPNGDGSTYSLTVTGTGAMKDYDQGENRAPWYADYAAQITSVTIGDGVTSVGACAFNGSSALTTVKGGDALAALGGYSFQGCPKIVSMDFTSSTLASVADFAFGGQVGMWAKRTVYLRDAASVEAMKGIGNSGATKMCLAVTGGGSLPEGALLEPGVLVSSLDKGDTPFIGWFSDAACTVAATWSAYASPIAANEVYAGYRDTGKLLDALETARADSGSVMVSTDGVDVYQDRMWVVPSDKSAFTSAIAFASAVAGREDATPVEINAAQEALIEAREAFNEAKRAGSLKVAAVAMWNIGDITAESAQATLYEDGMLLFSGTGDLARYATRQDVPWSANASQVKSVRFAGDTAPVNLDYYFSGCTNLELVGELPSTVTSMRLTFANCTLLEESPAIPDSTTSLIGTFNGCISLKSAPAIPLQMIDMSSAFFGCTSLAEAPAIPQGVTLMVGTFQGCTSLGKAPIIPSSVTSLYQAFFGCTSLIEAPAIPLGVSDMQAAFFGCTSLRTAPALPDSVTIVRNLFNGCTSLESAPAIPANVTDMQSMFQNCIALKAAPAIPDAVTNLRRTFFGCSSITQVPAIPDAVTNLRSTFQNCTSLISLPSGFAIPSGADTVDMFTVSDPYSPTNPLDTLISAPADASVTSFDWASMNRKLVVQDFAALTTAISNAETAATGATVSSDGKDVANGSTYVTASDLRLLTDAISAARDVAAKVDATQDEIDAAASVVGMAKDVFNAAVKTAVTNFDALNASLAIASEAKASTQVSDTNGNDVAAGEDWVTQAHADQLQAVIDAQALVATNVTATQNEVDVARMSVNAATSAFNDARNTAKPATAALAAAVQAARFAASAPQVSLDGKDVPSGQIWCTPVDKQALDDAISASQDIVDLVAAVNKIATMDTSQNGVDASLEALNDAVTTFNAHVNTAVVITDDLSAAVKAGNEALPGIKVSTDGSDVFVRDQWMTQEQLDAYKSALASAQRAQLDVLHTQNGVDAALADLSAASLVFDQARQHGSKVNISALGSTIDEALQSMASAETLVNREILDAYQASIAKAQAVFNDPNSTQDEVDAATGELMAAKAVFDAAKQAGTAAEPVVEVSGVAANNGGNEVLGTAVNLSVATGDSVFVVIVGTLLMLLASLIAAAVARRRIRG